MGKLVSFQTRFKMIIDLIKELQLLMVVLKRKMFLSDYLIIYNLSDHRIFLMWEKLHIFLNLVGMP